jgi:fructose/tagatose bisphosphate aldolase
MSCSDVGALRRLIDGVLRVDPEGVVSVIDESQLRETVIDHLVWEAVFSENAEVRDACRWLIRASATALGAVPSSIQGLYEAMGRGEVSGLTVPAMNLRGITYEMARAAIRAAIKRDVGALIFEIAKSEIGYTEQRPAEYASAVLAAAVKEGFKSPVFIQGDHFQAKAAKYFDDREKEITGLKDLVKDAIDAGFYNIDIDSSTLVVLERPTEDEQQKDNYEVAAAMTTFIREHEPPGITVSVGGEIGEVGGKNSTVGEFSVFMEGFNRSIPAGMKGLSKISVQTGTSHGGIPLPDGTIAKVKLDFNVLEEITKVARDEYRMSGTVQHGASTLPDELFHRFPESGAAEVHLATGFQNIIYDHEAFPGDLRERVYAHLKSQHANEWKEGQTEEQFIYKTRKKGFGPYKKELWSLPKDTMSAITLALEEKFGFLYEQLNVPKTLEVVEKHVASPLALPPVPEGLL